MVLLVLVSVILPSYNHSKYLREAIESVLNQSFRDFELIILDDCSKDESNQIILEYQKKDTRIKAFFHNENKGIAVTVNELIDKSSGQYIAHLASDDVWVSSKLEQQLEILSKNDSLVVWSEGQVIDQNSIPTGELFTEAGFMASTNKKSGNIFEELIYNNFIFGCSLIYKKKLLEEKKIKFNEHLAYLNDHEFFVELSFNHLFYFMKKPLAKYRIHGKNTILSSKTKWRNEYILLNDHFLRKYDAELSQKAKASIFFNLSRTYWFLKNNEQAKYYLIQALKNYWLLYEFKFTLINLKKRVLLIPYLSNWLIGNKK